MQTQLYFWKKLMVFHKKELLIVEKYYNRTKNQFDEIEQEADEEVELFYNSYPSDEYTDPSTVAEWALERGIEMYENLITMKSNHLLMTISLLYHSWEQQLIKFTIRELRYRINLPQNAMDFRLVQTIFELHGVKILDTRSWTKIKELKLIVNTIKHGDGDSAKKLRKIRPEFFKLEGGMDTLELKGAVLLDGYSLQVKEADFYEYLKATRNFWDEMPERAYADIEAILNVFEKQFKRIE